jgi:hypothetical protein
MRRRNVLWGKGTFHSAREDSFALENVALRPGTFLCLRERSIALDQPSRPPAGTQPRRDPRVRSERAVLGNLVPIWEAEASTGAGLHTRRARRSSCRQSRHDGARDGFGAPPKTKLDQKVQILDFLVKLA